MSNVETIADQIRAQVGWIGVALNTLDADGDGDAQRAERELTGVIAKLSQLAVNCEGMCERFVIEDKCGSVREFERSIIEKYGDADGLVPGPKLGTVTVAMIIESRDAEISRLRALVAKAKAVGTNPDEARITARIDAEKVQHAAWVREYQEIANIGDTTGYLISDDIGTLLMKAVGAYEGAPLDSILTEIKVRLGTLALVAEHGREGKCDRESVCESLHNELEQLEARAEVAIELVQRLDVGERDRAHWDAFAKRTGGRDGSSEVEHLDVAAEE